MEKAAHTSAQTQNWELLAQLALCSFQTPIQADLELLLERLVGLLKNYLPHTWGMLVATNATAHDTARISAVWGLPADAHHQNGHSVPSDGQRLTLRSGNTEIGYLFLAPNTHQNSKLDQTFYTILTTQLALVLQAHTSSTLQTPQSVPDDFWALEHDLLEQIYRAINTTLNLPDLLTALYNTLQPWFTPDTARLVIYRPDQTTIDVSLTIDGTERKLSQQPELLRTTDPLGQILIHNKSIFQRAEHDPKLSVIGAPILNDASQISGAILLGRRAPTSYTEREQQQLQFLAARIGQGIKNTYLQSELENRLLQVGLLNFISSAVSSTQEMEPVYTAVLDTVVQITHADTARLLLHDRDHSVGRVVAEYVPTAPELRAPISFYNDPAIEWLEQHQTIYVRSDVANDPLLAASGFLVAERGIKSLALVPLVLARRLVGLIELDATAQQVAFSSDQLEFCQTAANLVATVVEKEQLYVQTQASAHALQVKVGELSTLLESAGILGSLLKPDEVISSLIDLVSRQLRVASVALWTLQGDDMLVPTALYGLDANQRPDPYLRMGEGMTGRVAQHGLPLIIHDIEEEGIRHHPNFFGRDNRLTSYMGVPIFYQDRVIGVLSVMSAERREFSSDEMLLLVGLASQAAIALQNARLFQERERRISELTSINAIGAKVNATFDLDDLLFTLLEGISEVMDTSNAAVGLYEEPRLDMADSLIRLRIIADDGDVNRSDQSITLDGRGLLDYVVLKTSPFLLRSPEEIQQYMADMQIVPTDQPDGDNSALSALGKPFSCWMAAPIMQGDHVLGVINLQSDRAFAYTEDDLRFLNTVASQTAVAISNAHNVSERERRLRELSILKEIGSDITTRFELDAMLEHLRYEMGQVIDVSTAMLALYDDKTGTLSALVCYNQGRRLFLKPEVVGNDATGWVVQNRQPLLLHTAEQGRQIGFNDFGISLFEMQDDTDARTISETQTQSFLVAPILSGDAVLGVINIQSPRPYAFDQNDLRFVMTVANQAAVTIANAYLFAEREKRIEELVTFNDITRTLSAIANFEELPEIIYRQTSRLIDTTNFSIALVNDEHGIVSIPLLYHEGQRVAVPTQHEWDSTIHSTYQFPLPPKDIRHWETLMRLNMRVIEQGEPLFIEGSESAQGTWLTDLPVLRQELGKRQPTLPHLWLGVPMIVADKVVGVLAVQSYIYNAYTSDHERILTTIASSSAVVLENARLFEQISNLAADLELRVQERTAELADANSQLLEEKERLETVHAITLELTSTLDLDEIIGRALEMSSTNLGVARGSIMMRDPQSGNLVCRAVLQDQGIVQNLNQSIQFRTGEGLAHWVIRHQSAVSIPDVRLDSRWVMEEGRAEEVRSVVAVPLITSDTTLGVLILSSPKVNYFAESQQRLLGTIANEVAIAINNAQLYSYITEMASRLADLLERQREETTRSRSIFQSMTEGLIMLDTYERVALINLAAEHMLGVEAAAVQEQPLKQLPELGKQPEQRERAEIIYQALHEGLETAKEREGIYSMSFQLRNPAQTITANVSPVTASDGRIYGDVIVLRDITAEMEADRLQKEFFSKVSHELRTPLAAITGWSQLLELTVANLLDEEQMNAVRVIRRNAKNLDALIVDILDLSKFEAGKLELRLNRFDIGDLVCEEVQSLRPQADEKNLDVRVSVHEGLPHVVADKQRINQVLTNLISNAIKYTYDGGTIQVRVFMNPADLVQIEVEDNGVGMSPEHLQNLFRPFYRADNPLKDRSGGTGLGLSIAKSLVELHDGEMWVTSELGVGSIFSFVLPLEQTGQSQSVNEEHA